MARLLIYDAYENKVYTYNSLNENDPMPYSTERTLTLREFRGKSAASTARASRWGMPSAASGRAVTAPAASITPAWPLMWARA